MAANHAAEIRIDPSEQIPEADLLEQQTPPGPPLTDDDHALVDRPDGADPLVDVADRWEQLLPVPSADDDYPHHDPGYGVEAGAAHGHPEQDLRPQSGVTRA